MAGKKKSLAGTIKQEFDLSQEGKAIKAGVKAAQNLIPGGSLVGKAAKLGSQAADYLDTGMSPAQQKEYKRTIGMSAAAWAKEKKKAGIKD